MDYAEDIIYLRATTDTGGEEMVTVEVPSSATILVASTGEVLVLRELNGASYEEMGQILALPPGTVKSRVARARLALAKLLREAL